MTDKPILFSAPMVRALLDGRKTQTRRSLKYPFFELTDGEHPDLVIGKEYFSFCSGGIQWATPSGAIKYRPGDRLWVREAWRTLHKFDCLKPRLLAPDISTVTYEADPERRNPLWAFGKLRPSMFMPRWASRITLEVTDVRVERLQDCSEADAVAEGIERASWRSDKWLNYLHPAGAFVEPIQSYQSLWDSINGPGAWEANPWVAAYTFTVIKKNINQVGRVA